MARRKFQRKFRCPACDSVIHEFFGAVDCEQCKTPLVRSVNDNQPRERPQISIPRTEHRVSAKETGYTIKVVNGSAFYECAICSGLIPLSSLMEVGKRNIRDSKGKIARVEATSEVRVRDVVIGFRAGFPSVERYVAPDGTLMIKSNSIPIIRRGPICERHK